MQINTIFFTPVLFFLPSVVFSSFALFILDITIPLLLLW